MGRFAPVVQGLRLMVTLSPLLCGFQGHSSYYRPAEVKMGKEWKARLRGLKQGRSCLYHFSSHPVGKSLSHGQTQLGGRLGNSVSLSGKPHLGYNSITVGKEKKQILINRYQSPDRR